MGSCSDKLGHLYVAVPKVVSVTRDQRVGKDETVEAEVTRTQYLIFCQKCGHASTGVSQ